jgi:hypothetical protein
MISGQDRPETGTGKPLKALVRGGNGGLAPTEVIGAPDKYPVYRVFRNALVNTLALVKYRKFTRC